MGDLYAGAAPGRASHSRDGRGERAIEARAAPPEGLTVMESRSHGDGAALDRYLAALPVRTRVRRGSSLKFCAIASGDADLYARFGNSTMEWDTAAGDAVLRAAGGRVDTEDGRPLSYGKPGFANPSFIARGRS
jgi:3'(2'), 5'-bisphosphate nucleotidase